MINSKKVKSFAKKCGADIVGIGSMDRFNGAPKEMDARYIFPDAKVIIGLGFRIPRGYLRGIEEGTHFFQYPAMGYAHINEIYAPGVIRELCCYLEDNGYEGAALRNTVGRGPVSDMTGAGPAEESPELGRKLTYFEPVEPGKPAADVQIHFRIAAYICGMGEIGWSKMFLTPEFGPRQRFAFVLTDAPLEADPVFEGKICDRCKACVSQCPGHAISDNKPVRVCVAGRELEWGKIDEWQCFFAYMGGIKEINPFLPRDAFKNIRDGEAYMRGEKNPSPEQVPELQKILRTYYPNACGYNNAMCGGRGCTRACMVHLEQQEKLSNKFETPFRKRRQWRLGM